MRLHLPKFSRAKRIQTRRGWTLLETVISVSLGTTILGTMLPTGLAVSNSMVAIGNYCDLNRASCTTLDTMSRDLRNTAVVLAINNNQVTVSNIMTGALITYSWDGSNRFTRTFNGTSTVMLTSCDYLSFNGYQRNPTNNFQFLTAPTPEQTKLISVSWRCSRKMLGAKVNTESVQTAQICIRN
jgi:type II secretory pathway component PulJ